jgi:hypothetical protein
LLLGWLVVGAGPAHADTATLTVSKSAGLNPDGENVTVTGKGFLPGISVFVAVCDPARPAGQACDMANYKMAIVDAGGGFVADVKLAAKFGTTDCLVTPCAVQTSRVGMGKDRTQEAIAPIGFAGGVPPSMPTRPQENAGAPGATAPGAPAGSPPAAGSPAGQSSAPSAPSSASSPATDSASSDSDDDGSNTAVLIGVPVAVVVVGAIVAFVVTRRRAAN